MFELPPPRKVFEWLFSFANWVFRCVVSCIPIVDNKIRLELQNAHHLVFQGLMFFGEGSKAPLALSVRPQREKLHVCRSWGTSKLANFLGYRAAVDSLVNGGKIPWNLIS